MSSAAEYREQAETLYRQARETDSSAESLALILRAIELEMMADALERGQVQQHGTQPPAPPPQDQPAQQQQQQQAQPPDEDE